MKKNILLILLCFVSLSLFAQKIDFVLPNEANKEYSFAIYNGLKMDTVAQGAVSAMGVGAITIPAKYKAIPAMGVMDIEGGTSIYLIINNENFSFTQGADEKLSFNGSLENELLYAKQEEALSEANKETYAQAYFKAGNAVLQVSNVLNKQNRASLFEKSSARMTTLDDVDIDKLYYGRFWFFVIDGLMRLSIGEEGFAKDMIRLLEKTKTEEVYVAFVEDIITITNQFGMDDAFDIIIPYVESTGRIEYPQGNVYDAFAMAKVRKGVVAPMIAGLEKPIGATEHKYTFIMFHQPGCDNCQEQLAVLKAEYNFFKEKDVRVITVSGAMSKDSFVFESATFLWSDKLCDYKGFAGVNFQKYGIIGTPTSYLLDDKNLVLGRFSMILDVQNYIRGAL